MRELERGVQCTVIGIGMLVSPVNGMSMPPALAVLTFSTRNQTQDQHRLVMSLSNPKISRKRLICLHGNVYRSDGSVPCRRYAKLDDLRPAAKICGERLGIPAVAALDCHAVFELLAAFAQAR
jgi:hypothetical protein